MFKESTIIFICHHQIKECADKAVITVKTTAPRKAERPNTAPAKIESPTKGESETKQINKRPNTTATKKAPSNKKPVNSSAANATKKSAPKLQIEKNLSSEEVDEIASQILPNDVISGLVDSNWKTRLSAVEQLTDVIIFCLE